MPLRRGSARRPPVPATAWPALVFLVSLASSAARAEERPAAEKDLVQRDDYVVRLAFPTEQDFETWRLPGFRIALGYGYGRLWGSVPETDLSTHHLMLRPSVRIDAHWSIASSCVYSIAGKDVTGLRWSVSLEPTFHPVAGVAVAVGVGYAGILGNRNEYRPSSFAPASGSAPGSGLDSQAPARSRSVLRDEVLNECSGAGWNALARAEVLFVVGPLFASGPFLQADQQWVECEESFGESDLETGHSIVVKEWWGHKGVSLGWWFSWR
ncbi:MAG: hypothetical protein HY903_00670 [Deltaproteobacteria bacterium]|nr:hypothetical protein [Deltaproteobacteria bacterium]